VEDKKETIAELQSKINNMEKPKNIYQKLLEVQKKVKGLSQDAKGNNYKYVTGNKVINAVKDIMNEQGLLLKPEIIKVNRERVDYKLGNGKEKSEMIYDVDFIFTWINCDTGEKDENKFHATGMNNWEKGLGSALTYAERYFLLKYFHIATDEDDVDNPDRKDEKVDPAPPNEKPKKQDIKSKAIKYINDNSEFDFIEEKLKKYKVKTLNNLNDEQLRLIATEIKDKKDKK
jgi:hypothetical protein